MRRAPAAAPTSPGRGEAVTERLGQAKRTDTLFACEVCAAIGPVLRGCGQVFVGIDVIGDRLTEINVTSPTGIRELERFDGINVAGLIWDAVEGRLQARGGRP